ncbi:MAG: hypothetical protein NTW96_01455 [Planctomycetia bacterium]|nr:hypothetical protein [Planctomycetia bacterium]
MSDHTLEDVQRDWRCLDADDFSAPEGVRLVSHEEFTYRPGFPKVEYIAPGWFVSLFGFSHILFNVLYAWRLLRHTKRDTVLILNGSGGLWLFVGLLNRFAMLGKRKIMLWDPFVEVRDGWRRKLMSAAMSSFVLIVVWSRKQVVVSNLKRNRHNTTGNKQLRRALTGNKQLRRALTHVVSFQRCAAPDSIASSAEFPKKT